MTSLIFVFLFLPVSLITYHIAKESVRPYILLLASLLFYACASPKYFLLLLLATLFDVGVAMGITCLEKKHERLRTVLFVIGVIGNLDLLIYYKSADFIGKDLVLPLGLSFFTFKAISYLADVYRGKVKIEKNPAHVVNYLTFFGQIESGPLSRYSNFSGGGYTCSAEKLQNGIVRFVIGFNKKVLLSNMLYNIVDEVFAREMTTTSALFLWLGAICFSLQLFFDFSGYSDMAIGITWMFGFDCPENFNYPYMTKSISEFWRRWHITLGSWFRDYVYIPMGGSRVSKGRLIRNILVVWVLTGIWHGANWNFIFWGITYAILIIFEKLLGFPERLNRIGKACYRLLVLLIINFEWVIFRADGLRAGLSYIKHMIFSYGYAAANARTLFLMKDNWFFLAAAVLFATPIIPYIEKKAEGNKMLTALYTTFFVTVNLGLFLWSVSFVVAGINNPFAYANF